MRVDFVLLILLPLSIGCGSPSTPDSATTDSGTAAATFGSSKAEGPTTVKGLGFTLQAPAGWTILPLPVQPGMQSGQAVGISSPLDLKNPKPMVVVSVLMQPVRPGVSPETSAAGILQVARMGDPQGKESETTMGGRPATRLITVTANTPNRYTTLKCVCPSPQGLLIFNAASDEVAINGEMATLDAMIASIQFTE